ARHRRGDARRSHRRDHRATTSRRRGRLGAAAVPHRRRSRHHRRHRGGGLDMTRRTLTWIVIATVVLVIELGATIGSTAGEPFSPVNGWGETRPANALTFVIVVLGCAALALFGRYPLAGATIAT